MTIVPPIYILKNKNMSIMGNSEQWHTIQWRCCRATALSIIVWFMVKSYTPCAHEHCDDYSYKRSGICKLSRHANRTIKCFPNINEKKRCQDRRRHCHKVRNGQLGKEEFSWCLSFFRKELGFAFGHLILKPLHFLCFERVLHEFHD